MCDAALVTTAPPFYSERLGVRARWWVVVLLIAAASSAELFAGFNIQVAIAILAMVLVPTAGLLAYAGRTVVRVDSLGLHVGKDTMPFDQMESVEGLDPAATRRLLGPEADPTARLFIRGYIDQAVLVRPLHSHREPYWLVSTRHPQQLIAAVEQAARATPARW